MHPAVGVHHFAHRPACMHFLLREASGCCERARPPRGRISAKCQTPKVRQLAIAESPAALRGSSVLGRPRESVSSDGRGSMPCSSGRRQSGCDGQDVCSPRARKRRRTSSTGHRVLAQKVASGRSGKMNESVLAYNAQSIRSEPLFTNDVRVAATRSEPDAIGMAWRSRWHVNRRA